MNPKRAMAGEAVELHFGLLKSALDFFDALEELAALDHVIGRLGALCARFFGVAQEIAEALAAVLGALNARMKTVLWHKIELLFRSGLPRLYREINRKGASE